jgi:hypothetical protein
MHSSGKRVIPIMGKKSIEILKKSYFSIYFFVVNQKHQHKLFTVAHNTSCNSNGPGAWPN